MSDESKVDGGAAKARRGVVLHAGTAMRTEFFVVDGDGNAIPLGQPFECTVRRLTPDAFMEAYELAVRHRDAVQAAVDAEGG